MKESILKRIQQIKNELYNKAEPTSEVVRYDLAIRIVDLELKSQQTEAIKELSQTILSNI